MYTIYGIVDAVGNVRYVGCTRHTARRRVNGHWKARGTRTSSISQWLATLDEQPSHVVLESNVAEDQCVARETAWIEQYGLASLLNMGLGGTGGDRWQDESRIRLATWNRSDDARRTNREAQLGKTHAIETRRKISETQQGRPKSAHQREATQRWYEEDTRIPVKCEVCGHTCRGRRGLGIHKSKVHKAD